MSLPDQDLIARRRAQATRRALLAPDGVQPRVGGADDIMGERIFSAAPHSTSLLDQDLLDIMGERIFGAVPRSTHTNQIPTGENMTAQTDALRRRIASLEAELARLTRFGEDTAQSGTVIRWRRKFPHNGQKYTFVALKAGGLWWITGSAATSVTWDELVVLLSSDGVDKVQVASDWVGFDDA